MLTFISVGYVYTRLVHKCLNAFATLKEYESELEILDELLKQRLWRRGKRARWYERRAVILMHHLSRQTGVEVVPILQKALNGVREALEDEDTGIGTRVTFYEPNMQFLNECSVAAKPPPSPSQVGEKTSDSS